MAGSVVKHVHLTIHSASALKKPTFTSTAKPFVFVSISTGSYGRVTHTTHTDREHGTNPVWGYRLEFEVPERYPLNENVTFEIRHNSSTRIDRSIGKVKVPLKDFVSGEEGHEKRVSYEVRSSNGEFRGKLILSYQYNTMPPMVNTADGVLLDDLGTLEVPNNMPTPSRLSAVDHGVRFTANVISIAENTMDIMGDS